jgi:hypothetical protein
MVNWKIYFFRKGVKREWRVKRKGEREIGREVERGVVEFQRDKLWLVV